MKLSVLDSGSVELIDSWGSDEAIIEAARMSTNKGFEGWEKDCPSCKGSGFDLTNKEVEPNGKYRKLDCKDCRGLCKVEGDIKLLKFLYTHKHFTPFEMAGFVIEVKAPIFVFREWHRHRTQCLPAGTLIHQGGKVGSMHWKPIEQIWENWHNGVPDSLGRRRKLPSVYSAPYRVLNEETLLFTSANIIDVWKTEPKQLLKITAGDRSLRCSINHKLFTPNGYVKAKDLRIGDEVATMGRLAVSRSNPKIIPSLRRGINEWTSQQRLHLISNAVDTCTECLKEYVKEDLRLDHVIPVVLDLSKALSIDNLRIVCKWCHRIKTSSESKYANRPEIGAGCSWQSIESIINDGEEECFDIEVSGRWNNFVANGFVVHNSYNEMSARYTPLPDENYLPSIERILINADSTNKQANRVGGSVPATAASAADWLASVEKLYAEAELLYQTGLQAGIPKELARIILPVGRYSKMRASANLRNWLAFLTLRLDEGAQWEIRQYAKAVSEIVSSLFPRTYELFSEGA